MREGCTKPPSQSLFDHPLAFVRTTLWGEFILRITGVRNLPTAASSFSSESAFPRRNRTRSRSSEIEGLGGFFGTALVYYQPISSIRWWNIKFDAHNANYNFYQFLHSVQFPFFLLYFCFPLSVLPAVVLNISQMPIFGYIRKLCNTRTFRNETAAKFKFM